MKFKVVVGVVVLSILGVVMLWGMYDAKANLPPYTWIKHVRNYVLYDSCNDFDSIDWAEVNSEFMMVKGLAGFDEDGDLSRLPNRISSTLREPLRQLERNTAGGVVSFSTNSRTLKIVASIDSSLPPHMTDIMSAGLDVYENGRYSKSFYSKGGKLDEVVYLTSSGNKEIDVYLPLYGSVNEIDFYIESDSNSSPSQVSDATIVYYGSSITQGCCASNPAMSYPAIISRMLQVEQINLGFSGNGIGDMELANYIVELSPSIVVLDYWANPSVESYAKTLPEFVRKIRAGLDSTPIIITSTFANPGREEEQRSKDEISKNLVQAMNKQGDDRMFYIDGLLNEDEVDGLVDGRHLNSYGFFLVAKRMSNYISRENLLNLSGNKLELQ